jgi:hypothetical protein
MSAIAGLMWNHSQRMTAEFARRGVPRVTFSGADLAAFLLARRTAPASGRCRTETFFLRSLVAAVHRGDRFMSSASFP